MSVEWESVSMLFRFCDNPLIIGERTLKSAALADCACLLAISVRRALVSKFSLRCNERITS